MICKGKPIIDWAGQNFASRSELSCCMICRNSVNNFFQRKPKIEAKLSKTIDFAESLCSLSYSAARSISLKSYKMSKSNLRLQIKPNALFLLGYFVFVLGLSNKRKFVFR